MLTPSASGWVAGVGLGTDPRLTSYGTVTLATQRPLGSRAQSVTRALRREIPETRQ